MTDSITPDEFRSQQMREMSERELQSHIIEYAKLHGWRVAHFRTSRQTCRACYGNESVRQLCKACKGTGQTWRTPVEADGKGFPDLILVRERVVWIETKSEDGRLSAEQEEWLKALRSAGQEAHVMRPSDWEKVERILA